MKTETKKTRVAIIHTSFVIFEVLQKLFAEILPDVEVINIVDDSLLPEVLSNGHVTKSVQERMNGYFKSAEKTGAHLIVTQCSTVGEAAEIAAKGVSIPLIKIDTRMAEVACQTGQCIGVVATVPTTLGPTTRLIEKTAQRLGTKIEVIPCLVQGAWEALQRGDRQAHNRLILEAIRTLTEEVDVVVCAQGSMMSIIPELGETRVPVLTSLRSGVQSIAEFLSKTSGTQRLLP